MQISTCLLAAAIALCLQGAHAADSPAAPARAGATANAADKLTEARSLIAAKRWPEALDALRHVNDIGSANWNNLMGYVLRKGGSPDLAASEKYYDEALRIDPHHRDALEYSGELYLMTGNLDKAQSRLASLATECAASCEQYGDLRSAIERYKAAGNKLEAGAYR